MYHYHSNVITNQVHNSRICETGRWWDLWSACLRHLVMRALAANRCLIWGEQLTQLGDDPAGLLFARSHSEILSKYKVYCNIEYVLDCFLSCNEILVGLTLALHILLALSLAFSSWTMPSVWSVSWMRFYCELLSCALPRAAAGCAGCPAEPGHGGLHRWPDRTCSVRRGPSMWTHLVYFTPPGFP